MGLLGNVNTNCVMNKVRFFDDANHFASEPQPAAVLIVRRGDGIFKTTILDRYLAALDAHDIAGISACPAQSYAA